MKDEMKKSERVMSGYCKRKWKKSVISEGAKMDEFFFFKQKTAYEIGTGDWSSDVCSSDLTEAIEAIARRRLQSQTLPDVPASPGNNTVPVPRDRKSVV